MVAWCYKSHGAAADEQLKKVDAGMKREHIAYGLIGLTSLYLMVGEEAMFVSYLITFFYPASDSFEAIKSKGSEAVTQLQHWIAFGFFALIKELWNRPENRGSGEGTIDSNSKKMGRLHVFLDIFLR
ncbi:hypothetical protein OSTOST_15880 [Ostertagia ostertagi]